MERVSTDELIYTTFSITTDRLKLLPLELLRMEPTLSLHLLLQYCYVDELLAYTLQFYLQLNFVDHRLIE